MTEEPAHDEEEQRLSFAEREANDLRELHLSATFLTPFAVAATQDKKVWLSNNQQDYKDHSKSEWKCCTRCSPVPRGTTLLARSNVLCTYNIRRMRCYSR